MLNQHPDDERLSALASRDDDATADAALTSHVDACVRCTELVTELGALRMTLAELPDLRPHRALRLLPPVADSSSGGATGWVRRLFAPALAAGAAMAMVGLVGTAAPTFQGMASGGASFQDVDSYIEGAAPNADEDGASRTAESQESADMTLEPEGEGGVAAMETQEASAAPSQTIDRQLPAERSPWPMVLFSGVALMIGAAMLRWIVVPRAG